jgi:hypothetical protein
LIRGSPCSSGDHYRQTAHPIVQSFEPGEEWGWCDVDEVFFNMPPNDYNADAD